MQRKQRERERENREKEKEKEGGVWEQEEGFYVHLNWKRSVENKATQKLNYILWTYYMSVWENFNKMINLLIYASINLNLMYFRATVGCSTLA